MMTQRPSHPNDGNQERKCYIILLYINIYIYTLHLYIIIYIQLYVHIHIPQLTNRRPGLSDCTLDGLLHNCLRHLRNWSQIMCRNVIRHGVWSMSSNLLFKRAPKCCKCYPFYFVYRCSVLQCSDWSGDGRNVPAHPSYSPSSSSNSPSSSAVASWYCWYSETKSFMLDSASVNSISSIPSPVYQCKKAWRRKKEHLLGKVPPVT